MRTVLTTITVAVALAASTGTAIAKPASENVGPRAGVSSEPARISNAAPAAPSDGTGALVYVLIGSGGILALAGAASAGAHGARRQQRLRVTRA